MKRLARFNTCSQRKTCLVWTCADGKSWERESRSGRNDWALTRFLAASRYVGLAGSRLSGGSGIGITNRSFLGPYPNARVRLGIGGSVSWPVYFCDVVRQS